MARAGKKNKASSGSSRALARLEKRLKKNPHDEEAFVRLWDAYLAAESWEALARLLQGRVALMDDGEEKVRALLRLGNLYDEKLGDARRAIDAYQQVLTIDARNRRALWSLAMLYQDLDDWEKVVEIYHLQLDLARTTEEKLALRTQLAQIYEERLEQDDQALLEYIRAARLAPQTVRVLLAMEKLALRTDAWRELLAVYQDVVERVEQTDLKVALYLKLARLWDEHLENHEQAEHCYQRALELSSGHTELLFSISSIYGEDEEWEALIATYNLLIGKVEQPEVKTRLRQEIARLYDEGLHDPTSAFFELVRVARYAPEQPGLLDDLYRLGLQADRQLELAAVLEDLAGRITDSSLQAQLGARLARLHLEQLHNIELASKAVARALEADPRHLEAQLVRLDILEAGRDYLALAQAIEQLLKLPGLDAELVRMQRRRLAQVLEEKLGQHDRAVELYRATLEPAESDDQQSAGQRREEILEQLYRRQGAYQQLLELLRQRQQRGDAEQKVELALEMADILAHRLHDSAAARQELLGALGPGPGRPRVLEELLRLGMEQQELETTISQIEARAASDEEGTGLLLELERLLRESGHDEQADELMRRLCQAEPVAEEVFALRSRQLKQKGQWRELAELYLSHSRVGDQKQQLELLYQAAEIFEDQLGELGRACDIYERVLALQPTAVAARKSLERLRREEAARQLFSDGPTIPDGGREQLASAPRESEDAAEPEAEAAAAPAEAAEGATEVAAEVEPASQPASDEDREPTLVAPAPRQASPAAATPPESSIPEPAAEPADPEACSSAPEPPAPVAEGREAATGQPPHNAEPDVADASEATQPFIQPDSPEWLRQYLQQHPQDVEAWERLSQLVAESEGKDKAFALLAETVDRLEGSGRDCERLYRRMSFLASTAAEHVLLGRLLQQRDWTEGAESAFRAALRLEAGNPEALDGLQAIYQRRGAPERFEAIISRALRGASDPQTRRALLLRRARLRAFELGRANDALEDLEHLLATADGDEEAARLQQQLLEAEGRFEQLADSYRRQLEQSSKPRQQAELHLALARLAAEHLNHPEMAEEHYRRALELDPERQEIYLALADILEARRNWIAAVQVLRQAAERFTGDEQLGTLRFREGRILEEELLRPEEAEQAYRLAATAHPPSAPALRALRELASRRGDWLEAIELGQQEVKLLADEPARAELLVELARIWEEQLGNPEQALECYRRAHECWPKQLEAARRLAESHLQARDHRRAQELLQEALAEAEQQQAPPAQRAELLLKLAQSAEALGRVEEARAAYRQALPLAADALPVLLQLASHLSRHGQWRQALDTLEQLLDEHAHRLPPQQLADLHCLAARAALKQQDLNQAGQHYRQALRAFPEHLPALRSSLELYLRRSQFQQAAEMLERLIQLSGGTSERRAYQLQLAELLGERLNQEQRAIELYRQLLEQDGRDSELLEKLRKLLVRAERYQEAVAVLQQLAHLAGNDRLRARYLRIAGDLSRERLDDDTKALDLYLRALRASPLDRRAHGAAVKILNRQRNWTRLARLYEDLLARLPPPIPGQSDQRQEILRELVELYRFRIEDPARACQACEQLLSLQPSDLKVREDLARLYELTGQLENSLSVHRSLITESPFAIDSYHALRRIFERQGNLDGALCVSATLSFLDEANDDERRLLDEHRHALAIPPGRRLGEQHYQQLVMAGAVAGALGQLFSFACDFARPLYRKEHREYRLRPRERLDLNGDQEAARLVRQALDFLGLPAPEVYLKGGLVKGGVAVNTSPPALILSTETIQRSTPAELRFIVGRAVAFTRPENLLAAALSPAQLRQLLAALVEVARPGEGAQLFDEHVGELARRLERRIPPQRRARLQQLIDAYRNCKVEPSIRDWLEGVEHTCNRAGFLFCGEIEPCIKVLKGARVLSLTGSHRSLIRELIFYSISEQYLTLRRRLKAALL